MGPFTLGMSCWTAGRSRSEQQSSFWCSSLSPRHHSSNRASFITGPEWIGSVQLERGRQEHNESCSSKKTSSVDFLSAMVHQPKTNLPETFLGQQYSVRGSAPSRSKIETKLPIEAKARHGCYSLARSSSIHIQ